MSLESRGDKYSPPPTLFHKQLFFLKLFTIFSVSIGRILTVHCGNFLLQKNYESVISQYKKKLEDAQELRKKVKAMEDKNMMYMQQNMDLEEVGVVIVT